MSRDTSGSPYNRERLCTPVLPQCRKGRLISPAEVPVFSCTVKSAIAPFATGTRIESVPIRSFRGGNNLSSEVARSISTGIMDSAAACPAKLFMRSVHQLLSRCIRMENIDLGRFDPDLVQEIENMRRTIGHTATGEMMVLAADS